MYVSFNYAQDFQCNAQKSTAQPGEKDWVFLEDLEIFIEVYFWF